MASTIKVDTIDTPSGSGNITLNRPLSGSGASLTNLPATALTSGIAVTANGEVTMSSQPAFSVKLDAADQNNIAVGSDVTVLFDSEVFDVNADFNTGTYTFTAPVTGKYQLNANVQLEDVDAGNTEFFAMWIITSNRTYSNYFDPQQQFNADCYYFNLNLSVLADMDAGDTARIDIKQHNGTSQTDLDANWTSFSGYLAC